MQKPNKLRLVNGIRFAILVVVAAFQWSFSSVRPVTEGALTHLSPVPGNGLEYKAIAWSIAKMAVYDSLRLEEAGLSRTVFHMALRGMEKLQKAGRIKTEVLSIIDFSKPSSEKRLYVIDLLNYELLFNTWVAHGMKSGKQMASIFSNKPSSYKSSLGFYVTGQPYQGSNGYSLKLQGVEKGINDLAQRRAIVLHGANYVSENYIASQGYIGRSQGCPAVPLEVTQPLIDDIKDGSCLFIYHPTSTYRTRSKLIR